MKKIFAFIILMLPLCVVAQDKFVITDTFDGGKFQWDEAFEKDYTVCIMDGYYLVENKDNNRSVFGTADMPIEVGKNFKLKVKINVPKIKKDKYWGIIFDFVDEDNFSAFLVAEKKCKIVNIIDGRSRRVRQLPIILSAKKNKDVVIEVERKSNKLTFSVDEMEAATITRLLSSTCFGFIVEGENSIKVDEISIEQRVD